jgi:hypothetical protein
MEFRIEFTYIELILSEAASSNSNHFQSFRPKSGSPGSFAKFSNIIRDPEDVKNTYTVNTLPVASVFTRD